jgi:hypothetical protein
MSLKKSAKWRKKFEKISGTMEGFCFVISMAGLSRPNTERLMMTLLSFSRSLRIWIRSFKH